MFEAGTYYVGDLARVLQPNELRMIFNEFMLYGSISTGKKEISSSFRCLVIDDKLVPVIENFWITGTPNKAGTLYDQDNKGWGFDWGNFGCIPFKYTEDQTKYHTNKVEFTGQFNCSVDDEGIKIGHLHFRYNSQ